MSQLTTEGIVKLIETYTKTYNDNPSIMLSGYGQENQTVADYSGRQILEFMQNADDAQSDCIYMELDTKNNSLSIANNGTPFSLEGVESLMFTGLSSKNKVEFIGNKGLGFRSILSWVHQVSILTKEVSFRFSKNYSEQYFDEFIAKNVEVKERIQKEIEAKKLTVGEKPIAALAFPDIITVQVNDFVTKVVLDCKEEMSKIEEQIDTITEETLLFLPHIKKILVLKDGEKTIELTKTLDNEHEIIINATKWNCYRSVEQLYDNKVKFKYAIAWKDNWDVEGMFFNYFPTDVTTDLPCIIHATFDLTNNRKEINDNAQNTFILDEIVNALGIIAEQHLKTSPPDWRAFQFLTPKLNNSRKVLKTFYKNVLVKRESIASYPTLDGQYVTKEEVIFHGDAFSTWVEENGFGNYFPGLLKKPNQDISLAEFAFKKYSASELVEICKKISFQIKDHTARAELIKLFTQDSFQNLQNSSEYLPLLISSDYTYEENSYDENVFALNTENRSFVFPKEFKISFIEPSFYKILGSIFENEIAREENKDRSRALKNILKNVADLGSNDITDVVRFIVSQTNDIIKENKTDNKGIVLMMIKSLFSIFDPESNAGNKTAVNNIPLLNRNNEIKKSDELFFGNDYLVAINTEDIFNGIYTADHYLLSTKEMGLEETEDNAVLSFFEWLGVNRLVSISKSEDVTGDDLYDYFDFLFRKRKVAKPDKAEKHNTTLKAIKINNIDAIEKLALNELLILLEQSNELKREINLTAADNSTKVFYKFGTAYPKQITVPYSFIYYQISKLVDFSDYTVSEDVEFQIMFKRIDLGDPFFTQRLDKNQLDSLKHTLKNLGTSESITDISEDRLKHLLQHQKIKFPDGNNSQSFYKKCLEFFLQKNYTDNIKEYANYNLSIEYFAKKGIDSNLIEIIEKEKVFYSDNLLLPKKILEGFYFINLPRRIGEENVKRIFEVKLIKDELSKIHFGKEEPHDTLTIDLNNYIEKLKPYFLSNRLEQIKLSKKAEAQLIKPLKLKVVKNLTYQFDGGDLNDLEINEFLPHKDFFYVKTNLEDLNSLQSDADFCDLIAEIVGMTFKISNSKNTFRRMFKDGVKDSYHIIKSDGKESILEEAKKLLGVSDDEKLFWTNALKKDFKSIEDTDLLRREIENILKIELPNYYSKIDFSALDNNNGIIFLKWLSENSTVDLKTVISENTLENWHKSTLENYVKDEANKFEQLLWMKANQSLQKVDKETFFVKLMAFDSIPVDLFKIFMSDNSFNLNPDYHGILIKWTIQRFKIDLNQDLVQRFDVSTKYKSIVKKYSFGENIEDMEKIINSDNPSVYSLMHFDGFENEVKLECDKQAAAKTAEYGDPDGDNNPEDTTLTIVESALSNDSISVSNGSKSGPKGGSYNSKGDRNKAASGKKQENRVKSSLLKEGYLVNHVSTKTDGKHYDLEYKKEGDTEWRFLEVKKDSGGYFFLSKAEKQTAISKTNVEKYDIAIVGESTIHIIKSPFNFNDESFEKNSKLHAEPTEYKINFKIEDHIN